MLHCPLYDHAGGSSMPPHPIQQRQTILTESARIPQTFPKARTSLRDTGKGPELAGGEVVPNHLFPLQTASLIYGTAYFTLARCCSRAA